VANYENPKIIKIYKNVYAVLDLFHISKKSTTNAGIIFTTNSTIFIDCGMRVDSGKFIWDFAKKKYPEKKDKYLILTHHHSDHSFGMKIFKDNNVNIIAHKNTNEFLENDNGKYKQFVLNRFFKNKEIGEKILGDVKIYPANQLIENDTVITIDNEEIMLLVTPGHTKSDICIYHKKSKTLFAGDSIYENSPPNTRFGNVDLWLRWKTELTRLKEYDIKNICPGHGKLCDKSIIDLNINYLDKVINEN